MRIISCLLSSLSILFLLGCGTKHEMDMEHTTNFPHAAIPVDHFPRNPNLWVFILAGQSNMAGRGFVEGQDTLTNSRVLTLDRSNKWILAREPLHYYEPTRTGLDCGMSFANTLISALPDSISIAIIPCAVGGSSIEQWLGDSIYRDVQLLSNLRDKLAIAQQKGILKGILWHQGESDANPKNAGTYRANLEKLFGLFRQIAQDDSLPLFVAHLGSYTFPAQQPYWDKINLSIDSAVTESRFVYGIPTHDLTERGDRVHFNSASQRILGKRFAESYLAQLMNR